MRSPVAFFARRAAHFCQRCERAFTLLELLTGIVIVAILAAIAVPTYQRAVENANAVKDANNLRQLGIGMGAYWADYNCLPSEAWPTTLNPAYLSSWRIFQSPFDKRTPSDDPRLAPVSYDVNGNLLGLRLVQVVSPPACIFMAPLMSDAPRLQFKSTAWNASLPCPLSSQSNGTGGYGGTHRNGTQITVLFCDMHAASMEMSSFHCRLQNPERGAVEDLRWNQ